VGGAAVTEEEVNGERLTVLEAKERNWWPIAVAVGSSLLSAILSVSLCLSVSERNADRGRQQRQMLAHQAEEQHQAICAILVSLDDNAAAVPPTTALGKAQARTYVSLRVSQGCPPRTEN
jgi:hypothetical protein